MSALQFLGKKSWHVGTKKNEEKVWLREQAAAKEASRVAELQKQLEEERRLEEARRLERESGRGGPAAAPRIDWMYEDPGAAMPGTADAVKAGVAAAAAAQEDALLGKKDAVMPAAQPSPRGGVEDIAKGTTAGAVLDDEGIRDELIVRDAEAKLRDDPLLSIRRSELAVREDAASRGLIPRRTSENSARAAGSLSKRPRVAPRPPLDPNEALRRAEKHARKEQRARIREERRERRAQRSDRGRPESGRENISERARHCPEDAVVIPAASERGRKRTHVEDAVEDPAENGRTGSQINGSDSSGMIREPNAKRMRDGYGLKLPPTGTRVAVQSRFEPRSSAKVSSEGDRLSRPRSTRPPPQSEEERAKRLAQMQEDACRLEEDRAHRVKRYNDEEDAEMRLQQTSREGGDGSGPRFMREFGRDAVLKAERGNIGHRVNQLRGSLPVKDD